jgi:formylmethanofuran dehydrogenase subunit A
MLTCLRGGHVIDPVNGIDGVGEVWFEGGRIVEKPLHGHAGQEYEVSGHIVMAGGIDPHSHIAGAAPHVLCA